ncbi:EAL domain-containing protein [Pseudomonas mosselii]|uniref:EAL domain-containing protein n=1 Tax=Pseudomonas mosselii TaxID=78327 RepID=A0AA42RTC2_9PSED|nr:EAL domain-containing protein [Pseudomonas mosselii]MDH1629569.1 EAL domain-containing protein [Pseudomonas mosselii]
MPNLSIAATARTDLRSAPPVTGTLPRGLSRRLSEAAIRRALRNREFVAFYQPKVDLDSGELIGVEVLARWAHPVLGLIAPAEFLPLVESLDLLDELFDQLLEQALRLRRNLLGQGFKLDLALNVHPAQLRDDGFARAFDQALKRHGCPAQAITLEILETAQVELGGPNLRNLLQLRLMGCGLAMDDFGSGFSSLQRLCELPFSEIKLDASFLRQLSSNPKTRAVIDSSISLAWDLELNLVIEGVETQAQALQLRAMGCSTAQGYFFARPMPAEQLTTYCLMPLGQDDVANP